ncbi:restriction endonuclease subunit M [Streptomyces viridochromogenes]|uniref:site-specific DNA-methyltransferase (adenine-specific) n=1 Tax=Streptomyces viridochromogenes TaxID=1938 RepID=A0A0J8C2P9_STRVR|nr:class I SAM-dependent DNA methyltransferase [Streptomyces viridochromogenes]KMS72040.1 restriction endonuclease subunit M [Streptomyces viridochromogenes]KOG26787.1 restriction endonuclease subunit M [Streptomyces viridochromogenes]KOG28832.1 restriction endonuclease subunit M [Streptomyces viridochromogenes]
MPPRQKKQAKPEDMKSILWKSADKLRGSLDAAEYKHFVLGLVFLKYVSDAMEEKRERLEEELRGGSMLAEMGLEGAASEELILKTVEDPLQYTGAGIFYVPPTARWNEVLKRAKVSTTGPSVGEVIDSAMATVESFNRPLKDTLPKIYNSGRVDEPTLAELVRLLDQLTFQSQISLDGKRVGARDLMGEVYEYFLAQFALAEGRKGGEYFTPPSVVRLLVEMLEPRERERVLDPACGSGGMFVQAEKFVETHGGNRFNVSVYGQERNQTTWRLAKMNLAIHGIEVDLGEEPADSFRNDQHGDVKADVVLANPPFNISDWGGELLDGDERWKYGRPPVGNANFAWIQHMVSKLAAGGRAGIVLANGSMSSKSGGEGDIRRAMIEDDLVACMVALPGQLFRSTQIPACLWFLTEGKGKRPARSPWVSAERTGQVLFIDGRELGFMATRTMRELSEAELGRIAGTFRSWRGVEGEPAYEDVPGFCRSVPLDELGEHDFVLTPGRYVGAVEVADDPDAEPVEAKIARLTALLREQFAESERLAKVVDEQLGRL